MQKIYRVECEEGKCPFVIYNEALSDHPNWNELYYNNQTTHPTPKNDELLKAIWGECRRDSLNSWIFGFESMASLDRWFDVDAHVHALSVSGFSISVYEVEHRWYHIGERQVIFVKNYSRKIQQISLLTLLSE